MWTRCAHLVVGDVTLSRCLFPRFADVGGVNYSFEGRLVDFCV